MSKSIDAFEAACAQLHAAHEQFVIRARQERAEKNEWRGVNRPPVNVSDHAALQYLRREFGLDVDKLKAQILDGRGDMIDQIKHGKIIMGNGYSLVVKNGVVVTIY